METEKLFLFVTCKKLFLKFSDASDSNTLSWGLLGPDIVGTIVDISRVKVSVNSISLLAHKPWDYAYFSTMLTTDWSLPENFKYFKVSSSIGKKPHVAPYSGAMLAIVALSAKVKFFKPSP